MFSSTTFFRLSRKPQMIVKKTFFNTNIFHQFHNYLFKLFSPQLKDQIDFESLLNTLIIHLLNQSHSRDTFHEHKDTDVGKFKNEVVNIFTKTEFDNSSETQSSWNHTFLAPHGSFRKFKKFTYISTTHYSFLKFEVDDEFSQKMIHCK